MLTCLQFTPRGVELARGVNGRQVNACLAVALQRPKAFAFLCVPEQDCHVITALASVLPARDLATMLTSTLCPNVHVDIIAVSKKILSFLQVPHLNSHSHYSHYPLHEAIVPSGEKRARG